MIYNLIITDNFSKINEKTYEGVQISEAAGLQAETLLRGARTLEAY